MYKDTYNYFGCSELKKFLDNSSEIKNFKKVLEIGSYEGIFSCYAAENFAEVVHTIDPFDINDTGTSMTSKTEENFNYNVSVCPSSKKIISHKETSNLFFSKNKIMFDFIYVDGSHEPEDAYIDLNNSFKFCNSGGVIWIDDYGSDYKTLHQRIGEWLDENSSKIEIFHTNYQVGLIKK